MKIVFFLSILYSDGIQAQSLKYFIHCAISLNAPSKEQ